MSVGKYNDIIALPHHQSKTRPHMSNLQRAAQFSAFAALKGFDEEIAEAVRYTDRGIELSEERKTELGEILSALKAGQRISVTYFLPDAKKAGGAFLTKDGILKKVDDIVGFMMFSDGETISFGDLAEIAVIS